MQFKTHALSRLCGFLFSFAALPNLVEGLTNTSPQELNQKSYITADQIIITQEGIFVSSDLGLMRVVSLMDLGEGLYLASWEQTGPRHGKYCTNCGGCYPKNKCQ